METKELCSFTNFELVTTSIVVPFSSTINNYYNVNLQAVMMSPLREKGISKQGYLTKAPFHGENNGTPGAKVK